MHRRYHADFFVTPEVGESICLYNCHMARIVKDYSLMLNRNQAVQAFSFTIMTRRVDEIRRDSLQTNNLSYDTRFTQS